MTDLVLRREIRRDLITPAIHKGINECARRDVIAGNSRVAVVLDGDGTLTKNCEVRSKNNSKGEIALLDSPRGLLGLAL